MNLYAKELYDALRDICIDAWAVTKVHYGLPRVEINTYPHVVIRLASVPTELILGTVEQVYTFDIILRNTWSTAPNANLEVDKINMANTFIDVFKYNTTLGDYGLMPNINEISFIESDDPNEPYYEIYITVSCTVHSLHAG